MRLVIATLLSCLIAAAQARAQDVDAQTPTFGVTTHFGYSVFKSEMVDSNDTGTTFGYGLFAYAGSDRSVGMMLTREQSTIAFSLNESSVALSWQDVRLRYRWGPVHAGLVLSSSSAWVVKAPPDADGDGERDAGADAEDYLDITTQGMGGEVGFRIPMSKRSMAYADLLYVTTSAVQEKALVDDAGTLLYQDRTVSLGPRMDVDLGASLKVTKSLLDVRGGFRYRTYQVTVDGDTFAELLNTTYLGLQAGWYF